MSDQSPQPSTTRATLPPPRRYILTHTPTGTSTIHSSPALTYDPMPGLGSIARSYATASTPAVLAADADVTSYLSDTGPTSYTGRDIVIPAPTEDVFGGGVQSGSHLVVLDFAPGGTSHMHRTVSVDYSICIAGHIKMEMDGGESVDLFPGDHVIQRGTNHKWLNGSQTEPARLIAVTLPCEPFEIPGTGRMLAEEHSVERAR